MKRSTAVSRRSRFIQVLQLPGTAGLILCIIGAVDQTSAKLSDQKQGKVLLKAGVLVFLGIYLCLVALATNSATEFNRIPAGEKRILTVILVALPLLAVRFTWTLLAYFSNFHTFRIYGGSVIVKFWMATLEELLIVIAFTAIGLMTPKYAYTDANGSETKGFKAQDSLGGIQLQEASWNYQPRVARR